jgi:rRNA maturation RNase YbeY
MQKDILNIAGAPRSWQLSEIAPKLFGGLRKLKLLSATESAVVAITCVKSAEMTRLNARYRGKRKPTDVLSFEQLGNSPKGVRFMGDLVLCIDVVRKQAREQKHAVEFEVAVLVAHGLLHLLGFDHEKSAKQASKMAELERKLLESAGLATAGSGLIHRTRVKKQP